MKRHPLLDDLDPALIDATEHHRRQRPVLHRKVAQPKRSNDEIDKWIEEGLYKPMMRGDSTRGHIVVFKCTLVREHAYRNEMPRIVIRVNGKLVAQFKDPGSTAARMLFLRHFRV